MGVQSGTASSAARVVTALWFLSGLAAAGPGLLLASIPDDLWARQVGWGLVAAGLVAFLVGAVLGRVPSHRRRGLSLAGAALVVPACLTANAVLAAHGSMSVQGWLLLGGAAAVLSGAAAVTSWFCGKR